MRLLLGLVEVVVVAAVVTAAFIQMADKRPSLDDLTINETALTPPLDEAKVRAFASERPVILSELQGLAKDDRWTDLQLAAQPWLGIGDEELTSQYNLAREKDLVAQLRTIPASQTEANLERYAALLALNPDEPRYQKKRDYYLKALEQGTSPDSDPLATLCKGAVLAKGLFPTTTELHAKPLATAAAEPAEAAQDTAAQAQPASATQEESLALFVEARESEGQAQIFDVECLVRPDSSVAIAKLAPASS